MRLAVVMLVFVLTLGCAGTRAGNTFDDLCIAGRLNAPSAEWLNRNPQNWKQHSDYTQPLKRGDRILNRDCSDVAMAVAAGERDGEGFWAAALRVFRPGS